MMKNKISKLITFLLTSLISTLTFAHPGHGNNNIFHTHDGLDHIFVMFIIGVLISIAAYYIYKKILSK